MSFKVNVENITKAANTLAQGTPPTLNPGGHPNVGGTKQAGTFAANYDVWLLTRQEDLKGAQQQVVDLVTSIRAAAKGYHDSDTGARNVFLTGLDKDFEGIDR